MQVILMEKVANLGNLGDEKAATKARSVRDGCGCTGEIGCNRVQGFGHSGGKLQCLLLHLRLYPEVESEQSEAENDEGDARRPTPTLRSAERIHDFAIGALPEWIHLRRQELRKARIE